MTYILGSSKHSGTTQVPFSRTVMPLCSCFFRIYTIRLQASLDEVLSGFSNMSAALLNPPDFSNRAKSKQPAVADPIV